MRSGPYQLPLRVTQRAVQGLLNNCLPQPDPEPVATIDTLGLSVSKLVPTLDYLGITSHLTCVHGIGSEASSVLHVLYTRHCKNGGHLW